MYDVTEPVDLSPHQRLTEIAVILATGYLRARSRNLPPRPLTENPLDVRLFRISFRRGSVRRCGMAEIEVHDHGVVIRGAQPRL